MKKPTEKWNPVFRTESIFTPCPPDYDYKILKDIIAKSQIPVPGDRSRIIRFIDIEDPEALAERLNEVNRTHHNFKHRNEAPAPATVRDELKGFLELSEKYHEALSSLGFTAKTHLGLNPEFFDSLQYNVLGLQIEAEKAIQSIETKSGAPKKSRSTTIIELSKIYEQFTGREPRLSRGKKTGKPGGPFFRFVENCLKCIDPADKIGDESLFKEIKKAIGLREEYFSRVNSAL